MRPDTFTVTTFWGDWTVMPLMLGVAGLTLRWALADWRKASHLRSGGATLPGWVVFLPLSLSAVGFALMGLSMLIAEPYWEHRGLWVGQMLLVACCLVGAILIVAGLLQRASGFGIASVLNALGLLLMSALLGLPALFTDSPLSQYPLATHLWFGLLTVCVGCLATGLFLGFPYNFARLPLGIAGVYSFGIGLMEIGFKRPGFPHLLYVYDFSMGLDYVWVGAESTVWQVAGVVKVLLAIGIGAVFLVASRRRAWSRSPS